MRYLMSLLDLGYPSHSYLSCKAGQEGEGWEGRSFAHGPAFLRGTPVHVRATAILEGATAGVHELGQVADWRRRQEPRRFPHFPRQTRRLGQAEHIEHGGLGEAR